MWSVPNRKTGYCTDDVSRAFVVTLEYLRVNPNDRLSARLASTYLAFLQHAQMDDGRFHNFMDYDRRWSDEVGTPDSCGRAIWALGFGLANAPTKPWRSVCATLLNRALASLGRLDFARSRAYAAIGLAHACAATNAPAYSDGLRMIAGELLDAYDAVASPEWQWFENAMSYDNARLPEAMIRAAGVLAEPRFREAGLSSLAFCERVTIEDGIYVPIGNDGWYHRDGRRARYAQQPLEAYAMVDAELAAFDLTGDARHYTNAELAMEWYHGKNSRGIEMAQGGGCYDGLEEGTVNYNMGAESTLAFLAAAAALAVRRARVLRAIR